ncbi:MAG TPA: hypothetical protein VH599_03715 [Ktedonobacterales bacterium]
MVLAGSVLFLLWAEEPAAAAQAASDCVGSLPPPPTLSPLDPSSIKLSEILTVPKHDWNCDEQINADDRWIELKNTSGNDESLFGLQLLAQGQALLLNSSYWIAANGYLVLFHYQIPSISLAQDSGQLQLLDGEGNTLDIVNYPLLGADQSFSRNASGQWHVTTTPTPGKANIFTSGGTPTPTPTATRRSSGGGGGGGSGGSGKPTATPTPIRSIVIPTDTPGGIAFKNPGDDSLDGPGGSSSLAVPSWLKITLIALIGAALLSIVVWYWRTWNQEPLEDS